MAPRIIEGIYTGGHVELAETPEDIVEGARVRVEFLPREATAEERRAAGDRLVARPRQGVDSGGSQPEMAVASVDPASREARRQAAFARMRRGIDLGEPPHLTREEIYDERLRELDRRRGA